MRQLLEMGASLREEFVCQVFKSESDDVLRTKVVIYNIADPEKSIKVLERNSSGEQILIASPSLCGVLREMGLEEVTEQILTESEEVQVWCLRAKR